MLGIASDTVAEHTTLVTKQLSIAVSPSPSSNDHEARIVVDGVDWLGPSQLGLDPPELRVQLGRGDATYVIVGRCECGCVGCDDVVVDVRRSEGIVEWIRHRSEALKFDAQQYDAELVRFAEDYAWEPLEREVERRIEIIFEGAVLEGRFTFNWASARIQRGLVHLSFFDGREQRLLDFSWDTETLQSALDRASAFYCERFEEA